MANLIYFPIDTDLLPTNTDDAYWIISIDRRLRPDLIPPVFLLTTQIPPQKRDPLHM